MCGLVAAMLVSVMPVSAQTPNEQPRETRDPMLFHKSAQLTVRGHLRFGVNAVTETNLFWDLAESATGNAIFDPDAEWLESYVGPGVSFERRLSSGSTFFGKVSLIASYTAGTDAFDTGDTGRVTLEEGHLGYRKLLKNEWRLEATLGPRAFKLGTGMFIVNGGSDGFERGALKFGPREAWENAGVLQLSRRQFKGAVFYLDANELSSNDTGNRLGGFDLRWDGETGGYAGFTSLHVIESEAVYPRAGEGGQGPPIILAGAREGLNTLNFYGRAKRFKRNAVNLALAADLAYQWNGENDLEAWGGRVKAELTLADLRWRPILAYSYQLFTGDDPDTSGLERFDPLYYDGSPSAWATGSKSAMVFINSNVQSHNLSVKLTPTPRDIATLRYAHLRAHELLSPIQFGQATRVEFSDGLPTVITGVTDAHLSDDFFIEYTRIITSSIFLTCGLSVSNPGEGIERAAGGDADIWTGGFINVVINY